MRPLAILLLTTLLLLSRRAPAQRCVPHRRPADRQVVLPNGDVVLLATRFTGQLMDVFSPEKHLWINAVRLDAQGKLLGEQTVSLPWPEWYYNYVDCQATYRGDPNPRRYGTDSIRIAEGEIGRSCALYLPLMGPKNELVVGYYLLNDAEHAYRLRIDARGRATGAPLDIDEIQPYRTGFGKFQLVSTLLREPGLDWPPGPGFTLEKSGRVGLVDFPDVALLPDAQDTLAARRAQRHPTWGVQGPSWWLPLPGALSPVNPHVNVSGNRLYLTVMRAAPRSCPPFNDEWPVMCCIDLRLGKLLWQYEVLSSIYHQDD